MRSHPAWLRLMAVAFLASLLTPHSSKAQLDDGAPIQTAGVRPALLRDVGLDQRLGDSIPLDLILRDEHGQTVALRQLFGEKPVILTLVYYQCPMLCTEVLNGLLRSAKELPLEVGKDFSIVTVSIDPSERPVLAEVKHELYTGLYGRLGASRGWHFLTGDEAQIKALAQAVGFRYAYDPSTGQFAHPSGIMLLTPAGKLARYFYGISYPARDLRLGLVGASEEKIGSPVDQVLLYCSQYDPATGKYSVIVSHVLKLAALATVLSLGGLVLAMSLTRKRAAA